MRKLLATLLGALFILTGLGQGPHTADKPPQAASKAVLVVLDRPHYITVYGSPELVQELMEAYWNYFRPRWAESDQARFIRFRITYASEDGRGIFYQKENCLTALEEILRKHKVDVFHFVQTADSFLHQKEGDQAQ